MKKNIWGDHACWKFPEGIHERVRETLALLSGDRGESLPETHAAVDGLTADAVYYTCFLQMMETWASPEYLHLYDRFLEAGHGVNHTCFEEYPALHGAVLQLNLPLVRRMVEAGAYLGLFDGCPHNGWHSESAWVTPLHALNDTAEGRVEKMSWGWRKPVYKQPLTTEEEGIFLEIMRLLLENGADPNETNNDSATPLFDLVRWVDKSWVKEHGPFLYKAARMLVKHGADRTAKHRNGGLILPSVYCEDNPDLFALLLGDDPETRAKTCPPDYLMHCDHMPGPAFLQTLFSLGVRADLPYGGQGYTPLTRLLHFMEKAATFMQKSAAGFRLQNPDLALTAYEQEHPEYLARLEQWLCRYREELDAMSASLPLLLEAGARLDVTDPDGYTLYEAALRVNDARALETLLAHGLAPTASGGNANPEWALETLHVRGNVAALQWHVAKTKGGTACLDLLLEAGCDVADGNKYRFTPLHSAALYGSPDSILRLLAAGADVHARTATYRTTPLHALMDSFTDPPLLAMEALDVLLDNGADPNAQDSDGCTPLHTLALRRVKTCEVNEEEPENPVNEDITYSEVAPRRREFSVRAAKRLISRGADITLLDHKGRAPLALASLTGNPELFDLLLGETAEQRRVTCPADFLARCAGFSAYPAGEALARLLDLGCDVNAGDERGITPLMRAVSHYRCQQTAEKGYFSWSKKQHLETVEDLLRAGADPDAVDNDGNGASAYAGPEEIETIYPLLLRYGCTLPRPDFSRYEVEAKKIGFFKKLMLRLFAVFLTWILWALSKIKKYAWVFIFIVFLKLVLWVLNKL